MNDENEYLEIAKKAALEAGEIIAKYFGKEQEYSFKSKDKSDFATQADLQSQAKIVEILTKNFPDHNIIAEESVRINNGSRYSWVIDPLDGTVGFAAGMPYFAVSIALLEDNKPILGVVYHVVNKDLYWAQKGKGAYLDGKKICVNKRADLNTANFALDFGHRERRLSKIDLYIVPILKQVGYAYSVGSAVMSLVLVARGIQDGTSLQGWLWDVAAGVLIVQEAGGQVTDLVGQELDFSQDRFSILATNKLMHGELLKVLNTNSKLKSQNSNLQLKT